jgi:putative DNA-invertase from lambdoid prophage Rac
MKKVAAYVRVSSDEQTTENQLPAIRSWCEGRGYELTAVYLENESAWRAGHQHELCRLLSDIRSGKRKYDVLVVWALDRLSRQGPLHVLTLIDSLKNQGVKVESLQEPFTSLPYGFDSVIYSFLAWTGKWESDRKSINTRAGLARAKANGKRLGRPPGSKDKKKRRKKRPVIYRYGPPSVAGSNQ